MQKLLIVNTNLSFIAINSMKRMVARFETPVNRHFEQLWLAGPLANPSGSSWLESSLLCAVRQSGEFSGRNLLMAGHCGIGVGEPGAEALRFSLRAKARCSSEVREHGFLSGI